MKQGLQALVPRVARRMRRQELSGRSAQIAYYLLFASFPAFFRFIFIVKYTFEHRTNVVFTFRSRL